MWEIEQSELDAIVPIVFDMNHDDDDYYLEAKWVADRQAFQQFLIEIAKMSIGLNPNEDLKPIATIDDIPFTTPKPSPCVILAQGLYNKQKVSNKFMITTTSLYTEAAQVKKVWHETTDTSLHIIGSVKFSFSGNYANNDQSAKSLKRSSRPSDPEFGLVALKRAIYRFTIDPRKEYLLSIALNISEGVRFVCVENRILEATEKEYQKLYSHFSCRCFDTDLYINNWGKMSHSCHSCRIVEKDKEAKWACTATRKRLAENNTMQEEIVQITKDMVVANLKVAKCQEPQEVEKKGEEKKVEKKGGEKKGKKKGEEKKGKKKGEEKKGKKKK